MTDESKQSHPTTSVALIGRDLWLAAAVGLNLGQLPSDHACFKPKNAENGKGLSEQLFPSSVILLHRPNVTLFLQCFKRGKPERRTTEQ